MNEELEIAKKLATSEIEDLDYYLDEGLKLNKKLTDNFNLEISFEEIEIGGFIDDLESKEFYFGDGETSKANITRNNECIHQINGWFEFGIDVPDHPSCGQLYLGCIHVENGIKS